jgi:hypothetical protein
MRNYRVEIEEALGGGAPKVVPFTFYFFHLAPKGVDLEPLRAKGLADAARRPVCNKVMPNVKITKIDEPDLAVRTVYETPVGTLQEVWKSGGYGALAPVEHIIKTKDDYRAAEFMVSDTRYEPLYDEFLAERARVGDSGLVYGHTFYSPLLDIQLMMLGQMQFCYDVFDCPDAVMSLYEKLVRSHRLMYDVVADSPAEYVLYGGNIVPAMLGPERVRDYVIPCWNAFADRIHEKGKKLGVHLDADNTLIADDIAGSRLDFVEAFTPPPDCPVSVAQARRLWPEKRLWMNFPGSVFLESDQRIRQATFEILEQAGDRRGFLMGVTEDVPAAHIVRGFSAVLDAIRDYCGAS